MGEDVFKPVSALSGGEKGRLALAKLIYSQKNVLVLDEPTNHLDIPSRESLENALDEYDGTIITVSHDRFFLDKIVNQILSFEDDEAVLSYDGNYTEFHDWKVAARASGAETARAATVSSTGVRTQKAQDTAASGLSKNQRLQLEKRIVEIEQLIPKLEAESASLTDKMSQPDIAADFEKLNSLSEENGLLEGRIKDLYAEWESAADQLK